MELREFISVRSAYNRVRQGMPSSERLTFEEFAILCRLDLADAPYKTSDIAAYQGALRPTMTHRTNHLASLGLIERSEGGTDRRNVVCLISEAGRERVRELSRLTRSKIRPGHSLSRTTPERICLYVDAMGPIFCKASDLVMLGLLCSEKGSLTIMQLVEALGLLQPTVSMSVSSLEDAGMVERSHGEGGARTTNVRLTSAGEALAGMLAERVSKVVVRRRRG